jgi:hypothetical protein
MRAFWQSSRERREPGAQPHAETDTAPRAPIGTLRPHLVLCARGQAPPAVRRSDPHLGVLVALFGRIRDPASCWSTSGGRANRVDLTISRQRVDDINDGGTAR